MKQFLLLLALSIPVLGFEQAQHSIFFDTFNFLQAKVNHFTGAVKRLVTEQKTIYVSNSTGTPSFIELPVRTKSYEALIEDLSSFFGKSINKVIFHSFFLIFTSGRKDFAFSRQFNCHRPEAHSLN